MKFFSRSAKKFASSLLIVMIAFGAVGCGSIVYKDSTVTYVAAGRAVTNSITDAATTLASAQDLVKESKIVQDARCPIAEPRIFLRNNYATSVIKMGVDRLQDEGVRNTCKILLACEASSSSESCMSTCYSAQEANCIATVEEKTAQTLSNLKGNEAEKYSATAKSLAKVIQNIEYGRTAPVQNALIKQSMIALTSYLDLLDKIATKRDNEIAADAKKISDRIAKNSASLQSLANKQLSDGDQATQTKITSTITNLGKLISDLKQIEKNAKDAAAIRVIVRERSATVTALVADISGIVQGDILLGATYKNQALATIRSDLQEDWTRVSSRERKQLLPQRKQLEYVDGISLSSAFNPLFAAMNDSHQALIQLVLNPSDKDKQELANAAFQEFKRIASDISIVINQFT